MSNDLLARVRAVPATLSELLARRAEDGHGTVRFLGLREDEAPIPVRDLAVGAGRVGAGLRERGLKPGSLLALMLRSDMDFARIFLGAAAAGVVPVPLYPPASLQRMDHYLGNLKGVLSVVKPDALVVAPEVKPVLELVRKEGLRGVRVLDLAELLNAGGETARFEPRGPDDMAFIQCTSGSTNIPKAVVIRHGNVMANLAALGEHGQDAEGDAMCLWLPMYHDMGLLGLLRPLVFNHSLVLMEPQTFLRRPVRWLHGFSRYRATMAGGPNFAYELLVRKVPESEREGLDLSTWRLAYNGAEPIRVGTIRRFLATYAPYGMRPDAMSPCYGMSETTLTATLSLPGKAVLARSFDQAALELGEAREVAEEGPGVLSLAGAGRPLPGHEVRIIDPDTRRVLPEGRVGVIVLRGPSVSSGYLNLPERTAETFGPWVPGDDRTWLRSSDHGFFHEGELFVVGRADDVIIVRGRKLHPGDVEALIEGIEGVRPGCTAAVRVEDPDEPGAFVIVAETNVKPTDELAGRIRAAIQHTFQLAPKDVLFVPTGTIPKTSSGKICRGAIRRSLAAGTLTMREEPAWLMGLRLKARITASRLKNLVDRD